jgi:hypothetical protein
LHSFEYDSQMPGADSVLLEYQDTLRSLQSEITATPSKQTGALGGSNCHMESGDPSDPFAFDYMLKPGISTQSNALAIA